MRLSILATATLATTFALGPVAAFADEPIGVIAPVHNSSPFAIQGFASAMLADEPVPLIGVEASVRVNEALDLEVDYARFAERPDSSFGLLGTGLRWRAVSGNIATYLSLGLAVPTAGAEVFPEVLVYRGGVGGEWTASNGVFVTGQVGMNVVLIDGDVVSVPEARLGVGVRF